MTTNPAWDMTTAAEQAQRRQQAETKKEKTMDEQTELAYRMMGWLNDNQPYRGGAFDTPYGVLWIRPGKSGWDYRYFQTEPLPIEVANTTGELEHG